MTKADDALGAANAAAGAATTAYLLGRGLAAEIDDLRFPDGRDPIPAPGLDGLLRQLGDATGEACNAADRVLHVTAPAPRARAVAEAEREAERAAARVRALAQLLLGVSSAFEWNDAIARAERAAVRVLFPLDGPAVPLVDDGLELHGRARDELRTELCGALCRMVVDHDVVLALGPETNPAAVVIAVDKTGNITVSAAAPLGSEARMDALGWSGEIVDGRYCEQHPDPPNIGEVVTLVLDTLRELHGVHGSDGLVTELA